MIRQIAMPAIALRHLSQRTLHWLRVKRDEAEPPFWIAQYEDGFFLRIPACEACADAEQRDEFYGLPVDLQHVFRALQPHTNTGWIMLDVDADTWPGLSLYKE
jgi:hypothetical protein